MNPWARTMAPCAAAHRRAAAPRGSDRFRRQAQHPPLPRRRAAAVTVFRHRQRRRRCATNRWYSLSQRPAISAATGEYAVPVISQLIKFGIPAFGICLGHQLLCLAPRQPAPRNASRPPRRQPPGKGPRHRPSGDHKPEPRFRRRRGDPARRRGRASHVSLFDGSLKAFAVLTVALSSRSSTTPKPVPPPQDSHYPLPAALADDRPGLRRCQVASQVQV